MKYSDLLTKYIEDSGLSLGELSVRLSTRGIKIDRSYISKLKNGNKPPASEEVSRALAEVTGGDVDQLLLAGHIEKAPQEIKPILLEGKISETGTSYATPRIMEVLTQKKIEFFEGLEKELGLDLADPEIQKKLKRAAKIIFSDED